MLHRPDRLILIDRGDVHGYYLGGIHLQEILQELIGKVRRCDLQVAHGAVQFSHLKTPAALENKGARSDEILHGESGSRQPFPVKGKPLMISHVEDIVHEL